MMGAIEQVDRFSGIASYDADQTSFLSTSAKFRLSTTELNLRHCGAHTQRESNASAAECQRWASNFSIYWTEAE